MLGCTAGMVACVIPNPAGAIGGGAREATLVGKKAGGGCIGGGTTLLKPGNA